ncbi:aquaporin [Candidatus Saccharibacteria bacterium]|nr:aquaporin [Candidatus Saccharibacteria bacterium]
MNGFASKHRKYIIEFIGTFFLVLTIGLSGGNALAIGAVLAAMVYMGGYISGAHYNPAVTLAILIQKKIRRNEAAIYMLVQLAAAIIAAGVYQAVHGGKMVVGPGANVGWGAALLVEIIFTFALVSVVLHTAVSKKTSGNSYYGLAIGFVLVAAVFAGGAISGGAYNPAVGLGPNLYDLGSLSDNVANTWLYLIGPFVGGLLATLVFTATTTEK